MINPNKKEVSLLENKKEIKAHCAFITIQQYIQDRVNWKAQHPKAKIIEELKTLQMVMVQEPQSVYGLKVTMQQPQQMIMINWVIIFEE